MQTFLPYPDFGQSAQCLDDKRLFKQAVEARQLVSALQAGPVTGRKRTPWYSHPAAQMWRGCLPSLMVYANAIIVEVYRRRKWATAIQPYDLTALGLVVRGVTEYPWWLGHKDFHAAHRSNLLRKDPTHYSRFGWTEPNDLDYWWPGPTTKYNRA